MLTARIQKLLPKKRFARNVSVLAGGTAASQAIVVLASPLLTRLYTPDDFGLLAVYSGLLGILSVVASLRYQLAIPLPNSDEEAASIVVLSLLIVIGTTMFTALGTIFFGEAIAQALNTPMLAPYFWLLPLGLLLAGVYQVLSYWAVRIKAFPAIARTRLTQSVSMIVVQIGGYSIGTIALLIGKVLGQSAGTSSLAALAINTRWSTFRSVRLVNVRLSMRRYKRFPLYSSWAGLFNSAGTQLPPILFAALFSPGAAGIYMLAHRVLAMPMQLLGSAIANVFLSSAPEARRNGQLASIVSDIHTMLAYVAMPPALILLLAGPDLFAIFFGEHWRQAGSFAQWMAPWIYLQFITSPLSILFSVLERQIQGLAFQAILLISRVGSLLVGGILGQLQLAIALYCTFSALCFFLLLVLIARASGNDWSVVWKPSLRSLVASTLLVAPLALYYIAFDGLLLWVFALSLTGLLTAYRYAVLAKNSSQGFQ